MKILIVGSGGREHAIGRHIVASRPDVMLYFAPGNAGTATIGENVTIKDTDIPNLVTFAQDTDIDLTIVGPEQPLVDGIVDEFNHNGLRIIGPNREAAQFEGSKRFSKEKMKAYGVPTAAYEAFTDYESAESYLTNRNVYPIVIKADGLAAGKGVTVAQTQDEAIGALRECFLDEKFGAAGAEVVIEDFLSGQEASIFAFVDGQTILPMVPAQDHKAAYDGDTGPNTGGMGAYSPAPIVTPEVEKRVVEQVFLPMLVGMMKDGIDYKGILYAGLMINDAGQPSVVEFNVRFGDPETQVVLPRLNSDLIDIFDAILDERLEEVTLDWSDEAAVGVVLASGGYPGSYETGKKIEGLNHEFPSTIHVIHAGTKREGDDTVTSGGRVLAVVGQAPTIREAKAAAYEGVDKITFEGIEYRTDISNKAL